MLWTVANERDELGDDLVPDYMAVPVTVTVGNPPPLPCSAADELFCDGFDHAATGGTIVRGSIDQSVTDSGDGSAFDFTSGNYHPYSSTINTDDVNLYDVGDGSLTAYWYGDFVPAPLQAGGVADASGEFMQILLYLCFNTRQWRPF